MNCCRTCNGRLPASASRSSCRRARCISTRDDRRAGFRRWTVPKIGEYHIRVVSIDGFPQESHAELLEGLDTLPIPYRWSTRFIYLDSWEADAELEKYRKEMGTAKGRSAIRSSAPRTARSILMRLSMEEDVVAAKADAAAGLVRYGYYSTAIIIMDKDDRIALDNAQRIATVIRNSGFNARIEAENAIEAWLGTLPATTGPTCAARSCTR